MKKQIITIALLGTLLMLPGCGKDTSSTSASSSGAEKAAVTSEAVTDTASSAATTKKASAATEADVTMAPAEKQTEGSVQLGNILFGGYVTAETPVRSKPDANSDALIVIPEGTQIGVSESDVNGWFITEFKDKIGYIPVNSVKEIAPVSPEVCGDNVYIGSVSANARLMSGTHAYAELLAEIPSGTQIKYYILASDEKWVVASYKNIAGYVESKYIQEGESGSNGDPYAEYTGQWRSEAQWNGCDINIQISRDRECVNVEVSAHSAVADYQWNYPCVCNEDGTCLECDGKGILKRTDRTPDGDIQEPVTVYSDGEARFNIKGGTLFWDDCKEGTASQIGFSKILHIGDDING